MNDKGNLHRTEIKIHRQDILEFNKFSKTNKKQTKIILLYKSVIRVYRFNTNYDF